VFFSKLVEFKGKWGKDLGKEIAIIKFSNLAIQKSRLQK
jgi:hypothetical protein